MEDLLELVEYLVKSLVDEPDEASVSVAESGYTVTYEVSVAESDLGKVIGRGGRTANAMRTIVKAAPTSDGMRHTIDILS